MQVAQFGGYVSQQRVIVPGTEPGSTANLSNALVAIGYFLAELHEAGVQCIVDGRASDRDGAGRWAVRLRRGDKRVTVAMPGHPVDQVRYVGSRGQNPYDYPRLHVDGEPCLWGAAMGLVGILLDGEDELS